MNPSRPYLRMPVRRRSEGGAAGGHTLVELLLGLLVLVLAVVLLGTVQARLSRQARRAQLGADLQALAAVFEKYHTDNGRWPATAQEAGAALLDRGWTAVSPVGGTYGWLPPDAAGRPGRITVTAFHPAFPLAITSAELLELDRQIDDGRLTSGRLRTGFNGWPVYLVQGKP